MLTAGVNYVRHNTSERGHTCPLGAGCLVDVVTESKNFNGTPALLKTDIFDQIIHREWITLLTILQNSSSANMPARFIF